MKHKESILNIVKLIKLRQGQKVRLKMIDPQRDWLIGLFLAIVIIATTGWWSNSLYQEYRNLTIENSNVNNEEVIYRESLVISVLEEFTSREKRFLQLTSGVIQGNDQETKTDTVEIPEEATNQTATTSTSMIEALPTDTEIITNTERVVIPVSTTTQVEEGEDGTLDASLSF
jgi:asparagine N-glycosylation enzyme membrane subunit Stt3